MMLIIAVAVLVVSVLGDNQTLEEICGRNKIDQSAWEKTFVKPEEWPWHVLVRINITNEYIDGTLISKNLVLTVASTILRFEDIQPDYFTVSLNPGGKKYEEKEVEKVIIYEPFNSNYKIHDIALLKLKTDIDFNDAVQPACVWSKSKTNKFTLPSYTIGTVVGYETLGLHRTKLTSVLRKSNMPMVPRDKCDKINYVNGDDVHITDDKFCAENQKDNTICIDDTGAPYQVYVPDDPKATSGSGAWYLRGLLQLTPVKGPPFSCDPEKYFIFTDIENHYGWIAQQIEANN